MRRPSSVVDHKSAVAAGACCRAFSRRYPCSPGACSIKITRLICAGALDQLAVVRVLIVIRLDDAARGDEMQTLAICSDRLVARCRAVTGRRFGAIFQAHSLGGANPSGAGRARPSRGHRLRADPIGIIFGRRTGGSLFPLGQFRFSRPRSIDLKSASKPAPKRSSGAPES